MKTILYIYFVTSSSALDKLRIWMKRDQVSVFSAGMKWK